MVVWSYPARADLKRIHDFISSDSAHYAKKVVQEIREKTSILNELPNIGKVVPEISDPSVRELHLYSYRIIYQIQKSNIQVLAVVHARRDISADDIS